MVLGMAAASYLKSAAECVSDRGKELCSDINGECITERDGYYYVSAICVTFGALFLVLYIIPTARRLQGGYHALSYPSDLTQVPI